MAESLTYADASALVKLIADEPESQALRNALGTVGTLISADIAEVELARAAARVGGDAPGRVADVLAGLTLVPADAAIHASAARLRPASLGTLDAIHLATALAVDAEAILVYDRRLADAAAAAHALTVLAPS